jgi:molybdate transport system permease protein
VEGHAPADATSTAVAPPAPEGRWALHAELSGAVGLVLDAEPGSTVAVVGPNGAGKTTLLRALLGLTPRARATRLGLGEREVAEHATHRRGIAWVPQDGALLPHLSALDNTAYGPRAQGVPRAEARAEARAWLDRLGVGQLTARRPGGLSGGQAGRVALARALAARPRLLLLDEPLAALDQGSRVRVRQALREHLAGFGGVCLLVTHDPVEAVSLADRVLVLQDGRVVQDAAPAEVVRHPRSPWVARMLGRNALAGTFGGDGRELELPGGARVVAAEAAGGSVDGSAGGSVGGSGLAVVGPEAVSLHRERPEGSPRNVWSGQVRELTAVGGRVRVLVGPDGQGSAESVPEPGIVAEVTPGAVVELELAEGLRIWLSVKATEVALVAL